MVKKDAFTEEFAAAPVNAETFAAFIEMTGDYDIAQCPADVRSAIANVLRAKNPQTYGELLKEFRNPEIASVTKNLSNIRTNVLLGAIWLFSHRVYDFLRVKNPSLPRSGYRPEEIDAMSPVERGQLDQEIERSFDLLENAMKEILGVDPGEL